MKLDDVSPYHYRKSNSPSKGRFLHIEDGEITLRETSLLQTFPPDYKFSLNK